MRWIWFRVRRQRAVVSIVVLRSISQTLESTVTVRISAGEIVRHWRSRE